MADDYEVMTRLGEFKLGAHNGWCDDERPGILIAWSEHGSMNITQDLSGSWLLGKGGIACRPTITS